jgi:hypothetical protein
MSTMKRSKQGAMGGWRTSSAPSKCGSLSYSANVRKFGAIPNSEERDTIKRDLQRQGYTVLPDRALPLLDSELEVMARDALSQCRLSVHLFGRNYGIVPEGTDESLAVLQYRLAEEHSASGNFSRLLWIPRGLAVEDSRRQAFLERLRMDPSLGQATDLYVDQKSRSQISRQPHSETALLAAAARRLVRGDVGVSLLSCRLTLPQPLITLPFSEKGEARLFHSFQPVSFLTSFYASRTPHRPHASLR